MQQPTTHAHPRRRQPRVTRDRCSPRHSIQGSDYKYIPCAPPNGSRHSNSFINKPRLSHSRTPYTALHLQNTQHHTTTCYTAHIKTNICFTLLHHSSAITLLVLLMPQVHSTNYSRYIGKNKSSSTPQMHTTLQTESCCVRKHHRQGIHYSTQNQISTFTRQPHTQSMPLIFAPYAHTTANKAVLSTYASQARNSLFNPKPKQKHI